MSSQSNVNYQQTIDQSDRNVPINLRQTGDPGIRMLISNRVRKSAYWHLSVEAGCWRATVYNRMYHPRGYVRPEDGGAMVEYRALVNDVTLWNVAVERPIRVKGPDAEAFCNYVCTRDMTRVPSMKGRYVILCDEEGHVLNDPVMLRLSQDEFWFTISDSDLAYWFKGINVGATYDVTIEEIDVSPLQIQGPKSEDLMADLVGEGVREVPYYGLMNAQVGGVDVIISQTGFSGEKGFEIYVKDAMENAEAVWDPVLETVKDHGGMQIAPGHHRRIAAGILSWGQDMDHETSPFQVNLGYQVPDDKEGDYVGKEALERQQEQVESGDYPFNLKMVGLKMAGEPIRDYASDFWLVSDPDTGEECGYMTSPWHNPEMETNIGLGFVPAEKLQAETDAALNDEIYEKDLDIEFQVHLPDEYAEESGESVYATVAEVPFKESVNPSAREQAKLNARTDAEAE